MQKTLNKLFDYYELDSNDKKEIMEIIAPIIKHNEFQKRTTLEFPHHGKITLGEHILSDTFLTYKLVKGNKYKKIDKKSSILIAMFHDLYTLSWQNNPNNYTKHEYNNHAYRHPVEAIINAVTWYPEYFKEDNSFKIIDGVMHHMYPVPVKRFDGSDMELKNENLWNGIPTYVKKLIIYSSNRNIKIGHFSLCQSLFEEGRIMSFADKKVSFTNYIDDLRENGLSGTVALLTGNNKSLTK